MSPHLKPHKFALILQGTSPFLCPLFRSQNVSSANGSDSPPLEDVGTARPHQADTHALLTPRSRAFLEEEIEVFLQALHTLLEKEQAQENSVSQDASGMRGGKNMTSAGEQD